MKLSKQTIVRVRALTLLMLFVAALPLVALGAGQAGDEISDEKLKAVAKAYIEVYHINQSYKPRIEAAQTTSEAEQLQDDANREMLEVIENAENVSVNEYNNVINALGDDDELRDRLQAHVDAIQEEDSEND